MSNSVTPSAGQSPIPPDRLFGTIVPPIVVPVFLAAADSTAVATALPAIGSAFGEVEKLSWLVVANLIATTIAAPAYGRLADLFGRRRMMLISLLLFMGASAACTVSRSLNMLLVCRVIQGLGSGGLMTLAQALIGEHVPARLRGNYQGYLSACIVAGSSFGPVGGGLLTQMFGWQSVFLANIPLSAGGMLLVARLPRDAGHSGRHAFDAAGLVLLTAFVVPLLLGVSDLQRIDHGTPFRLGAYGAAVGVTLSLLIWQQRRTRSPLLAPSLLRLPAFWRSDVMAAGSGASLTAMVTFLPIYLQVVKGVSPAESGLMLLPLTASVSSGSVFTGWLISKTGRTAIFPTVGLMFTGVTLVLLAVFASRMNQVWFSVMLALGGLCQGSAMLTAQITVQSVASVRQLGAAAGSVQLARSLGSAFGAAVAGAVLFATLSITDQQAAALFFEMVQRGPQVLDVLPPETRLSVQQEIADAFSGIFLTVACFSCIIVAASWTQPIRRL